MFKKNYVSLKKYVCSTVRKFSLSRFFFLNIKSLSAVRLLFTIIYR
jgi:hypothetical protein